MLECELSYYMYSILASFENIDFVRRENRCLFKDILFQINWTRSRPGEKIKLIALV